MAQTLIVIDMQKDFVDGALGTKEAVGIVENVKAKIKEYVDSGRQVIFTRDTHHEDYLETNEGKHLPVVHCIEGTPGWEIYDGVYAEGCDIINKPAFGYTGWGDYSFESVTALATVMQLLKGIPFLYQGQEIGMRNCRLF